MNKYYIDLWKNKNDKNNKFTKTLTKITMKTENINNI